MTRLDLILAAVFVAVCPQLPAAEFFVSPAGDDTHPGTQAQPFATLERARDAVRKLKEAGPLKQSVTVLVSGGTYRFQTSLDLGEQDSGTQAAGIVWQATSGEEVRLCGGVALAGDAFQVVSDEAVLARLDPAARGHVMQADLGGIGIPALGGYPDSFRGAPAVPELFFNDQRMTPARWPNEGWETIAKIVDSGAVPRQGDTSGRPGTFEYRDDRPSRWNIEAGVWLLGYWCFDWYEETIKVQAIDVANRQITLARPTVYGIRQGNPSPRRYRALNVLEELDQPGEFYLDHAAGRLVFWPPNDIRDARIVLSTLNAPVVALKDASHLTLRGFVIEASLGVGIQVSGGSNNRIEACHVRNTRQEGIQVTGGTAHLIECCQIHDTGTGGLVLAGGERRTLTPAGHAAVNNRIWRFSQHQLCYASGITLSGVGQRAAHNLLYDAPHMAVSISGNDHVFEYNVVHDVCNASDDAGALYKGRNPSCRGNIIRYNFWRDIGSPLGHGTAAVYFDDGDGGDTVFGNIFLRCGHPGRGSFGTVFSHGGHDNIAENNIFIECQRALGSAPWSEKRWKETVEGGHGCYWQTRLLEEVDVTQPPYTTRYPELVGFMDPQPGQVRVNHARNNVLVRCGQTHSGNWEFAPEEIWQTDADPGFVDAANGDFQLRPDAEVFQHLPGFQPIPFDRIGPQPCPGELEQGLIGHWPLAGDARDHSGHGRDAVVHGNVDLQAVGRGGAAKTAAGFNGRDGWLEVPTAKSPPLGCDDFSIAVWLHTDEALDDVPGDILSRYDPAGRRGFHLSLKSSAVTTSLANQRHLHFGIDNDQASPWTDCGRPGNALLAFALTVHEGALYAGTCEPGADEAGRVYRYDGGQSWVDCGAPDRSNSVTALAVYDGQLYAGTGKYRVAGSALPESENVQPGGRVFRYAGGDRWIDCGQLPETEAVGGMIVFGGRLYVSSLYQPAGFFRHEGDLRWTDCGTPDGKRVVALGKHNGHLYATSYDGGHVYRYDGRGWIDCGRLGENTQTYSFAAYQGRLYVGTWPSGRVYRFEDVDQWTDVGRLGEEMEVMGMLVHNGRLIAGTLPLAEVYSYEGQTTWKRLTRLDHTPDVRYRRAWTMAEHDGRVFCSTLPSGKVFAFEAGVNAMGGQSLSADWRHIAAVKSSDGLTLYVDGRQVAQSSAFDAGQFELDSNSALRIGFGENAHLCGRLADLRLYGRVLTQEEIRQLAASGP